MSLGLTSAHKRAGQRPAWSGTAFIVEALFLLLFLVASIAIFVQLFAHAEKQSAESVELSRAVALASNAAEHFAANPEAASGVMRADGLVAVYTVTSEQREGGVLYHAEISVYADNSSSSSGNAAAGSSAGSSGASASGSSSSALSAGAGTYAPAGEAIYTITTARYVGGESR